MTFSDYYAHTLDSDVRGAPLDTIVSAAWNERSHDYALEPDEIVNTKQLTHTLTSLSDVFRSARQRFNNYKLRSPGTEELNEELAAFTAAVLNHSPGPGSETLGDQLRHHMSSWLSQRAHHLDKAHRRARSLYADLRGERPSDYLVFRFEHLGGEDLNEARAIPVDRVPYQIVPSRDDQPPLRGAEQHRRENMLFPTEEQAHDYLQFFALPNKPVEEQQKIRESVEQGRLRITSENHTVFGENSYYDPVEPRPKIISRTKQGQVGKIAAEPYKLFASLFGERDTYSYDSIALWPANMDPADNVRFLLGLAHSDLATAGNGSVATGKAESEATFYDKASYIRDGFRVTTQNNTPGSPYDFHSLAAQIARDNDDYDEFRQISQVLPPSHQEESKRKLTYHWAVGNSDRVPSALNDLYDETLERITDAHKRHREEIVRRDADIVEHGEASEHDFQDLLRGWKGEITAQLPSLEYTDSKAGEVNVPLEVMVADEPPYRHGAGWYSGNLDADSPGVGLGNHAGYKSGMLDRHEELRRKGLLGAYEVLADSFPTLSA